MPPEPGAILAKISIGFDINEPTRADCEAAADDVIALLIPVGYVVAPEEMTEAMQRAAWDAYRGVSIFDGLVPAYRAALSARPDRDPVSPPRTGPRERCDDREAIGLGILKVG